MQKQSGFTLIELMVVIAIIGILAAIAIPQFIKYKERSYQSEAYQLAGAIRKQISNYYDYVGYFPENNEALGLPEPEHIRGKFVSAISIAMGVIHIQFDKETSGNLGGKVARLEPHINAEYPTGPLTWEWIDPLKEHIDSKISSQGRNRKKRKD